MDKVKNSNNTKRGFSKKVSLPQLLLSRITTVVSYLWKVIIFYFETHENTQPSLKAWSHCATQVKGHRDFNSFIIKMKINNYFGLSWEDTNCYNKQNTLSFCLLLYVKFFYRCIWTLSTLDIATCLYKSFEKKLIIYPRFLQMIVT